jgi:MFS family permease
MVSLIWRVNIATMLFFTLVQIVVPFISAYADTISNDTFLIGFAVSSVSITAILLRPVSGVVSDRWSRSKMMILGLLLASLAYFTLFLAGDILHVVIARLIEGVGVASFVPSSIASAVDQAPHGKLGQTLGWRSLMIGIGFLLGPSLGGFLVYTFSFRTTFSLSSILLILLIPLVVFKGTRHKSSGGVLPLYVLKERNFVVALSGLVIYALAWMGLYAFLPLYLISLGYTPEAAALIVAVFAAVQGVFSLVLRVVAGKVADRRPDMMAYLGLLAMVPALLVVGLTRVPPYLYLAAPIFGIGIGTYVPGSQTLALMKAPPDCRGLLSSVYTMGLDVGNLIGPIMFGLIIQSTNSFDSVFTVAPLLMFVAAMVVMIPTMVLRRHNYAMKPP